MTRPQTIVKEQYAMEKLVARTGLSDEVVEFQIYGSTPSHSYEDRDVYFDMSVPYAHLRGEDAITLGQALIKHGTNALKANMYQHQHIHHINVLNRFIADGLVEKLIFEMIDDSPANYGDGWKTYLVKPVWANEPPQYQEDFAFETNTYWSPFEDEFKEQIGVWKVPVEFEGYDHEKAVADFNKEVESYNVPTPTAEEMDAHVIELAQGLGLNMEEVKGIPVEGIEAAREALVQSVCVPAKAFEQTNEGSVLGKGCTDPIRYMPGEDETSEEAKSHVGGIAGYPVTKALEEHDGHSHDVKPLQSGGVESDYSESN